mmetsp:Transcript_127573/g.397280  ORF Transcript_127573/g.397280 Transcript_127573/m.397280 type:complete len:427 (-) Transcript_127573:796-2076(-)
MHKPSVARHWGTPARVIAFGRHLSLCSRPARCPSAALPDSPPSRLGLEARPGAQTAAVRLEPLLQAPGGRQHEAEEEGPWLGRAASELGVELASQEEGVAPQLAQFHTLATVVLAGEVQAPLLHGRHAGCGDLVAVPVALVDHGPAAIEPASQGLRVPNDRGARAQAHGASHDGSGGLRQEDHDRVASLLIKLRRVSRLPPKLTARKLDHGRLQAHAYAQVGHVSCAAVPSRGNFALDAPIAEAARHEDPLRCAERLPSSLVALRVNLLDVGLERRGVDPRDGEVEPHLQRRVLQCFHHADVRVGVARVLADEGDPHLLLASVCPVGNHLPISKTATARLGRHRVGGEGQGGGNPAARPLLGRQAQALADDPAGVLLLQEQRHPVEVRDVVQRDDTLGGHLAEERELLPHRRLHGLLRTAHEQVWV